MSRRAIPWAILVLFACPPAPAAPVPASKDDDTVPLSAAKLLHHRKVQKELKMTPEQRITLVDALADLDEEHEKQVNTLLKMPNVPDEALDKLEKKQRKAVEKLFTDTAGKSLSAGQRTRLRQIDWQLRGPAAFTDPRVEKGLQLTDDQKKAAAELAERMKAKADHFLDQQGNDNEETLKSELFTFRKDSLKKFVDALKPDQRDIWKAMVGEPVKGFDLDDLWLKVIEDEDQDSGK